MKAISISRISTKEQKETEHSPPDQIKYDKKHKNL